MLPVVIPGATAFDNTFYFFTPAKTLPITFSVIKSNQALGAKVAVVITDLVGNKASCI